MVVRGIFSFGWVLGHYCFEERSFCYQRLLSNSQSQKMRPYIAEMLFKGPGGLEEDDHILGRGSLGLNAEGLDWPHPIGSRAI